MSRTISIDITDPASVSAAVSAITAYERLVVSKCEELRRRVAFLIATRARDIFNTAIADDLMAEGYVFGNVEVTVEHHGATTLVIANGEDAIFMEFGSGIYHNGAVGSSPNPWGAALGYTIGSYGPNGAKNVWGFTGADGKLHLTHGVPASMPLYRVVTAVAGDIVNIARRVFST